MAEKDSKQKVSIGDKINLRGALIFTGKFLVFATVLFILFSFISSDYYTFVFGISKPFVEHFHPGKEIELNKETLDYSVVGSFTNIIPFIALVLAVPGIKRGARVKIILVGCAFLLLLQFVFMVSALSLPLEIEEKKAEVNQELDEELGGIWANLSAEKEQGMMNELKRLQSEGETQEELDSVIEKLRSHECGDIRDEKIRTLCSELMSEYQEKENELMKEKQKEIKPSWLTEMTSSFLGGPGMIIFPFILWIVLCYSLVVPGQKKDNVIRRKKPRRKKPRKFKK